jgi:hypothetical protein
MLADYVEEIVAAPGSGLTIVLPGVAPAGRQTWISAFPTLQPVLYSLDDLTQEEWGFGTIIPGAPSTLTRDTVIGTSAGTTARLNFTGPTRCYSFFPMLPLWKTLGNRVGRNLFHNPLFRVQQRGAGPFTVAGYTADRWVAGTGTAGGTRTVAFGTLPDAARLQIGDEEAAQYCAYAFSGGGAAGDFDVFNQRIEGVRRTSNKTLIVSFWANAGPSLKVGISVTQVFGTGGSANVTIPAQVITVVGTWARYTVALVIPSATGKTIGTVGTDYLQVTFYLSAGANSNGIAGGIGVQAGTINLWGMQAEIGPAPSPLEKPDIRTDWANCQRYYQDHKQLLTPGYQGAGGPFYYDIPLTVFMRITPTVTLANQIYSNASALAVNLATPSHVRYSMVVTALGAAYCDFDMTASADL